MLADVRDADPDLLLATGYTDDDLNDLADAIAGTDSSDRAEALPDPGDADEDVRPEVWGASSSPATTKRNRPASWNAWLTRDGRSGPLGNSAGFSNTDSCPRCGIVFQEGLDGLETDPKNQLEID
ncbi:hypothetical protein AB0K16_21510 [Nonomuraea jabiensis]|uniref:hypothetical protein n=1 Tax=Nonomuraea jabiensis TaxID=882448 RepID=UPI0034395765